MDAITYTSARAHLAKTMERVCEDHEPLIITRSGEQSVVMLALEDFKALEETAYLLRRPTNARRLLAATQELEAGKGKVRPRRCDGDALCTQHFPVWSRRTRDLPVPEQSVSVPARGQ